MARKYVKTEYVGVYYRQANKALFQGQLDKYWYVVYRSDQRTVWENVGKSSLGCDAFKASEIRADRMVARPTEATVLTFDQAFDIGYKRHFINNTCRDNYKSYYTKHISPILGAKLLSDIKNLDIEALRDHLVSLNRAPATIKQVVGIVRKVFSLMERWGLYWGKNPARRFSLPRKDNKRERYLTRDEVHRLLEALKERYPYLYQLSSVSLYTGMRLGEIGALKTEHVNLTDRTIRIVDPKNKSNRTVYIPETLLPIFDGLDLSPGQVVFKRPRDGTREINTSKVFQKVTTELGLNKGITDPRDRVVFHSLRHTYASWLVSQGLDISVVGALLGHKTPAIANRYARVSPEAKRAALDPLESFLKT
jgi:integrase